MISTIYGEMDEALLTPNHSTEETDGYRKEVTQYLLDGQIVHSSAHVIIKKGREFKIEANLNG